MSQNDPIIFFGNNPVKSQPTGIIFDTPNLEEIASQIVY